MDFNDSFNEEGRKPRFISKHNPLVPHSWQIFALVDDRNDYEPVGDYTLLDTGEAFDITEKKIINLVALMNGKKRLVDFTNLTTARVLYNIILDTSDSEQQKIVFRTYDGQGVSKENAILTINKGVFDDSEKSG
ncbi:MAG: hypothetical protein K9G62_00305 [Alphaproteobacteria bacterium]|nr:hypothetical protein [Alphaproteobacteria bacterium]